MRDNPMVLKAIGSIVRTGLAIVAGVFVRAGIWTASDADTYVTELAIGIATALVVLAWSLWDKYKTKLLLNTAAAMPKTTIAAVRRAVAMGQAPPVSTPETEPPALSAPQLLP